MQSGILLRNTQREHWISYRTLRSQYIKGNAMTNEPVSLPVSLLDMVSNKTFDNRVFYMYASGWVSPDDVENFENPNKYCDCKSDISATQAEVYREVLVNIHREALKKGLEPPVIAADELGTLDFALQVACFKWIGLAAKLSVELRDRLKSEWFKSEVPKPLEDGKTVAVYLPVTDEEIGPGCSIGRRDPTVKRPGVFGNANQLILEAVYRLSYADSGD